VLGRQVHCHTAVLASEGCDTGASVVKQQSSAEILSYGLPHAFSGHFNRELLKVDPRPVLFPYPTVSHQAAKSITSGIRPSFPRNHHRGPGVEASPSSDSVLPSTFFLIAARPCKHGTRPAAGNGGGSPWDRLPPIKDVPRLLKLGLSPTPHRWVPKAQQVGRFPFLWESESC